jgi:hypothetical protein
VNLFTVEERTVMTSRRPIAGLATLALIGACGAGIQPGAQRSDRIEILTTPVEASTTSIHVDQDLPQDSTRPEIGAIDPRATSNSTTGPALVAEEQPVTTTTISTTTTTPDEAIDLQSVFEALNALDDMLGDFEPEVEAIDLDEEEGETP